MAIYYEYSAKFKLAKKVLGETHIIELSRSTYAKDLLSATIIIITGVEQIYVSEEIVDFKIIKTTEYIRL